MAGSSVLDRLQERIRYRFSDVALLQEALTHRSFVNEHPGQTESHNERLEFLGDAVLDLLVSERIFLDFPQRDEGELTRIRAEVVNEASLAACARRLDLGAALRLGRGEDRSGGRAKDSLLADAFEALLGALYREAGPAAVRGLLDELLTEAIAASAAHREGIDGKSRLQELLQGRFGAAPQYRLSSAAGPDHERLYTVEVVFREAVIGSGSGRSKKAAEQAAARAALAELDR